MADFTLDTSGQVIVNQTRITWSDLSSFDQGYIEAAFASEFWRPAKPLSHHKGFSDLAPPTLEGMLRDCAALLATGWYENTAESGADCWADRSAAFTTLPCCDPAHMTADFPPIHLSLNDEGKIVSAPVDEDLDAPTGAGAEGINL